LLFKVLEQEPFLVPQTNLRGFTMGLISNISEAFSHGGLVMWIIFFGQIASIAIIIERSYALFVNRTTNHKKLAKLFEEDIKKGRIDTVISKARDLGKRNALGRVVEAGAQAALDMGGKDEIQSKMDEVLLSENAILEKRTGFLAAIGNIGTLAGLLGTIMGLIDSFQAVAHSNPLEKATLLSQGISMAMHATAYGLIMAIPALVMYAVFTNRANTLAEDINQSSLMIFNWLSYNYEPVNKKLAK
jgi:biopolymer transport protein ExbB